VLVGPGTIHHAIVPRAGARRPADADHSDTHQVRLGCGIFRPNLSSANVMAPVSVSISGQMDASRPV
jgi:hypothetical protein